MIRRTRWTHTKPSTYVSIDYSHPLARGLKGLWLFNEGTGSRVNDLSIYKAHGTALGGPAWGGGKWGSAMVMDASNDRVNAGTLTHIRPVTNSLDFSIAVWGKFIVDALVTNRRMLLQTEDNATTKGWMFINNPTAQADRTAFYLRNGASTIGKITPVNWAAFLRDVWHCYVGTYNASAASVRLLIGHEEETTVDTTAFALDATNEFVIGSRAAGDRTVDGQIAMVAYWENRQLLPAEVSRLEDEPYGFLAPAHHRRYIIPAAAAAPLTTTKLSIFTNTKISILQNTKVSLVKAD